MNEEQKFPAEVRSFQIERPWEEIAKDESAAEIVYKMLERGFHEVGMKMDFKDSKVLEVGSGKSVFLDYLKKQGVDAVGVDARPRGETDGLQIVAARIEQLPFKDEAFDVVLSNSVFDDSVYSQEQQLMLKEINRVLKHGGIYAGTANDILKPVEGLTLLSKPRDFVSIYRKA